jgi:threonine aldolase
LGTKPQFLSAGGNLRELPKWSDAMTERVWRGLASDNYAGIHPDILKALTAANEGHAVAYGDDPYTAAAVECFREQFGEGIEVFFVFLGTAANVLSLQAATAPYQAIICAESSHINVDECGAPERHTGCKLLTVPAPDGKLTCEGIGRHLHGFGFEHHAQPRAVSITQATELGTVYRVAEIQAIADLVHRHQMVLHMDGARLANAAVHLGTDLRTLTADCGVDVLSFGGTKNGMMAGEAIVFFDTGLARNFKYRRKQGMQLASKMRFIAAQFQALLSNDLWQRCAAHANRMASLLAEALGEIAEIHVSQPVESNGVFVRVPQAIIAPLQAVCPFYVWDEATSEVRWMTSFDTTEDDIRQFVAELERILAACPSAAY